MQREDDMAAHVMHLELSITFQRFNRCAPWLLGWSSRSSLFLVEDPVAADHELNEMKEDQKCYETFKDKADDIPGLSKVVNRSAMKHVATQQIVQIAGKHSKPVLDRFLEKSHSRLLASQAVEDGFNEQKNAKPTAWQNRRGNIQSTYKALVEERLLSTKHHFEDLDLAPDPVARDLKLPASAFKAHFPSMPKTFHKITGFSAKPTWETCRAQDWGVGFAELVLMRRASSERQSNNTAHGAHASIK